MGKLVSRILQALPAEKLAGLFVLLSAMRFPTPLRSRDYGNPEDIVAARQAEAANKAMREAEAAANAPVSRRPVLTVRKGWHARQAAEALFTNFAPEPVLASGQGIPRNVGLAGDAGKNSE